VKHLKNNIRGLDTSLKVEKWRSSTHKTGIENLQNKVEFLEAELESAQKQTINKRWALFLSGSLFGILLLTAIKAIS
jgi:hypothetical protein